MIRGSLLMKDMEPCFLLSDELLNKYHKILMDKYFNQKKKKERIVDMKIMRPKNFIIIGCTDKKFNVELNIFVDINTGERFWAIVTTSAFLTSRDSIPEELDKMKKKYKYDAYIIKKYPKHTTIDFLVVGSNIKESCK